MKKMYRLKNLILIAILFIVATIPSEDFLSTAYVLKSAIALILAFIVCFLIWKRNLYEK